VTSRPASADINVPRPFVYISAEDIFRPVIPARYIETKWEAERGIEEIMTSAPNFRGVYIRPSACSTLSLDLCVLIRILFVLGFSHMMMGNRLWSCESLWHALLDLQV